MDVTIKKTLKNFKVYIKGLLHLTFPINEYSGIQSWSNGDDSYTYMIEYHLKSGKSILCEYEDRQLWEEILKQIDKNL